MPERKTPREILAAGGKLEKDVIAVQLRGRVVDLHTPVDATAAELTPIHATDPTGLAVIRHSTAHVMADAVQRLFPGTKVTIGPAIEDGFYYDFDKPGGGFTDDDLRKIEQAMLDVVRDNSPFRRDVVTRDEAHAHVRGDGRDLQGRDHRRDPRRTKRSASTSTARRPTSGSTSAKGRTSRRPGFLKAVKLTHVAGAYWRGDERNPMLQRIYGTAFPTPEALEEHLKLVEAGARQRDHRKLGKELELFMFDEVAPAMPFFLPRGAFVYQRMVDYVRDLYERYGYEEVITPQVFDPRLFRTSGHLGHYNENMYRALDRGPPRGRAAADASVDRRRALARRSRTVVRAQADELPEPLRHLRQPSPRRYRELPWRMADFGRLHRYERGGVVHGLARVRSFCQDDAHIFCDAGARCPTRSRSSSSSSERGVRAFHFEKIDIKLATRPPPDKRFGSDEEWDASERALADGSRTRRARLRSDARARARSTARRSSFTSRTRSSGRGSSGPSSTTRTCPSASTSRSSARTAKITGRSCSTARSSGRSSASSASISSTAGATSPSWLAPKQAIVLTVSEKSDAYARQVVERLRAKGLRVEADLSSDKLGAKIRNARLCRVPLHARRGPEGGRSRRGRACGRATPASSAR